VAAVSGRRAAETGLTLTEVTVVMILGTLIMAGLVGFYLSSQGLWLDGSTQAITQREASLVASAIRDSVRRNGAAVVLSVPDSLHQQLGLKRRTSDPAPYYYFWWDATDSLVYSGTAIGAPGSGPIGLSRATRLKFSASEQAVRMDLRMLSAQGSRVDMSAFAVFKN
jgi:hypothetical protein